MRVPRWLLPSIAVASGAAVVALAAAVPVGVPLRVAATLVVAGPVVGVGRIGCLVVPPGVLLVPVLGVVRVLLVMWLVVGLLSILPMSIIEDGHTDRVGQLGECADGAVAHASGDGHPPYVSHSSLPVVVPSPGSCPQPSTVAAVVERVLVVGGSGRPLLAVVVVRVRGRRRCPLLTIVRGRSAVLVASRRSAVRIAVASTVVLGGRELLLRRGERVPVDCSCGRVVRVPVREVPRLLGTQSHSPTLTNTVRVAAVVGH